MKIISLLLLPSPALLISFSLSKHEASGRCFDSANSLLDWWMSQKGTMLIIISGDEIVYLIGKWKFSCDVNIWIKKEEVAMTTKQLNLYTKSQECHLDPFLLGAVICCPWKARKYSKNFGSARKWIKRWRFRNEIHFRHHKKYRLTQKQTQKKQHIPIDCRGWVVYVCVNDFFVVFFFFEKRLLFHILLLL